MKLDLEMTHASYCTTLRLARHSRCVRVPAGDRAPHECAGRNPAARPHTLTKGERELIATYVSSRNCTHYCHSIHGAIAAAHLGGNEALVKQVKADFAKAEISPKLKALLAIAGKVQQDGKLVTSADVEAARLEGATDLEIHDTVLIAAAFCMYNRYVDGLATWAPEDIESYRERAAQVGKNGYRGLPAAVTAQPNE